MTPCCENCRTWTDRDYTPSGEDEPDCREDFKTCPCHQKTTQTNGWEIEFDKDYAKYICDCAPNNKTECPRTQVIKTFIRDFLAKRNLILLEKIEGMKIDMSIPDTFIQGAIEHDEGFNWAIEKIKALIQE